MWWVVRFRDWHLLEEQLLHWVQPKAGSRVSDQGGRWGDRIKKKISGAFNRVRLNSSESFNQTLPLWEVAWYKAFLHWSQKTLFWIPALLAFLHIHYLPLILIGKIKWLACIKYLWLRTVSTKISSFSFLAWSHFRNLEDATQGQGKKCWQIMQSDPLNSKVCPRLIKVEKSLSFLPLSELFNFTGSIRSILGE